MSFSVPANLETEIDELITHYPVKRSASLMLLHALQEHFGYISHEATEWVAKKLGLQPINVHELVTFYPMFRQQARRQISDQSLSHAQLRARWFAQVAQTFLRQARP
ncbi:MAG: NAD(P)H-dependent oxidoreductase subunit E [Verrucomicrobiota bacterium]